MRFARESATVYLRSTSALKASSYIDWNEPDGATPAAWLFPTASGVATASSTTPRSNALCSLIGQPLGHGGQAVGNCRFNTLVSPAATVMVWCHDVQFGARISSATWPAETLK